MNRLVCCIITSIIIFISSFTNATTVNAITGQNQYKVVYTDTMSLTSSNYTWTRQTGNMFMASGTHINSWTPQFNFGENVTMTHNSVVYLDYSIFNTGQLGLADGCLTALGNWEVLDCQYQVENISFRTLSDLTLTCSSFGQVAPTGGVKWCESWTTGNLETLGKYNDDIWTINYYKYVLRYTGGDENITSIVNNIRLGGTLFTKISSGEDIILIKLNSIPFFREGASVTDIYNYLNENDINQQQQQAGEQAQQDGQQGSNASQNSAEQGTQSLLSAITGFVGVIANATPTNCRISGNMGALDIGQLDFCQDNPPAIITTIGTLILIAITIPITIWVIKKIISMFRSFTNG